MCRLAVLQINKANHPQPPTSLGPPSSNHPPDHLLLIRHLLFPPLSCLPQEQTSICLTTIRIRWIRRFLLSRINIVYMHIYIYARNVYAYEFQPLAVHLPRGCLVAMDVDAADSGWNDQTSGEDDITSGPRYVTPLVFPRRFFSSTLVAYPPGRRNLPAIKFSEEGGRGLNIHGPISASSFCFHRRLIDTDSLTGFWRDALVLHDVKLDLNRSAT